MIHLRIADILLEKWNDLDKTAFIMGNISPDSGIPNADWSSFTPDTMTSHLKILSESGAKELDLERFRSEYLSLELFEKYSRRERSFFMI